MTLKELEEKGFYTACEELLEDDNEITTYDMLKEFAIKKLEEENVGLALHILNTIYNDEGEYYEYDYSMGTLQMPKPLLCSEDLRSYCEDYNEQEQNDMQQRMGR